MWEDGRSSVACVARDAAGVLLLAAGFLCDYDTILEVETRGAWEAIWLSRLYFPRKCIWIEGDALLVIQELTASSRQYFSKTLYG